MSLLRRIARRCETHDRASTIAIHRMEDELGMPQSEPVSTDEPIGGIYVDRALIDCGNTWCRHRR